MTERNDLVLGTAGHIDHGKTALVRALTGVDTDRLPAEKQRGITIDLGFAALELGPYRLAMVDVPGHERFVRNMLAGATGLDLTLLVIAADDSVMPQTREHLEILRLLGLGAGAIALTKVDLVDASWLELVEEDVRRLVAGTFLETAPIVRTSATTGLGLAELRAVLETVCAEAPRRNDPGLFRMSIDRAFTVAGHGTVVTGTVASGSVAVGDDLELAPGSRPVRVRGIQRHERPVERVGRGARAAINLGGVKHTEVERGNELAAAGYLADSRIVSVELRVSADAPRPIRHRARYRLHLGTAEVTATLVLFGTNELGPGQAGLGQLHTSAPLAAVYGQPFVLRQESPSATLGGGTILQPRTRRLRRRDVSGLERLQTLRDQDPVKRLAAVLAGYGLTAWREADLVRDVGVPAPDVESVLLALERLGALIELPIGPRRTIRVLKDVVGELEDRVIRSLGRLHAARPRQTAIARAHLTTALADLGNESLVFGLVERLKQARKLTADARTVALAGYEPKLSQGERRLKTELAEAIRSGGFAPPELPDLVALAGARANVLPELLALLVDEQKIVPISPQVHLDFDVEAEMRRRVRERLADGSTMTMSELRDLLGTTRKFAVPIGEYLDRIGLTCREGDLRRLGFGTSAITG